MSSLDATHARRMDEIYRYQRYFYDLTRKYYLLGRDRMIAGLDVPHGGSVLEIGCGTGRNLIAAARLYPQARFYGFDISSEMLVTARRAVARAGLADRIVLAHGDATDFDARAMFATDGFDRVFVSYALSMIPGWHRTLPLALAALKPDGTFSTVDFGWQEELPGWFRVLLHRWLARFDVTPRAGLVAAIRDEAMAAGRPSAARSLYRGYATLVRVGPAGLESREGMAQQGRVLPEPPHAAASCNG